MEDVLGVVGGVDLGGGIAPLVLLVIAVFLFKKLLRFALFLVLIGVVMLILESQGSNLVAYVQGALAELPLQELFSWLVDGKRD